MDVIRRHRGTKGLAAAAAATLAALVSTAHAQNTPPAAYPTVPAYPEQQAAYPQQQPAYPQQQPAYPQPQPAYPQQPGYPQQPFAVDPQMAAQLPRSHPIRNLFAGTIATVLQATGASVATSLTQSVAGGIASWFSRKNNGAPYAQPSYAQSYPNPSSPTYSTTPVPAYTTPAYPTTQTPAYPATPTYSTPASAYPTAQTPAYPTNASAYPGTPAYPTASPTYPTATTSADPYGVATSAATYPQQNSYTTQTAGAYPAAQVYDAQTGQLANPAGTPYTASGGYDGMLYAGIAYEVHAVGPGGTTAQVDPATHVFHSGDRFIVHYRPSMPGRMEVFNINPAGQQTRIDAADMAAGQLASLGPYEFTAMAGDESLRIVLSPCSTQQLLVATRDIVNVAAAPAASSATGFASPLGTCGAPTTRGLEVRTRDIRKVAVDGGTAFALDPVSATELSGGQIAAREITIVFHHR